MKYILHHLIACCVLAALFTSVAAAQNIELRLSDGSRWRGEVGDHVELSVLQRGVETAMTGRITADASLYLTLEVEVSGETRSRTIFKSDIVSIKTAQTASPSPRGTRPGAASTTRTPAETRSPSPNQREARAADAPGVFVLPFTGMVGKEARHEEIEAMAAEADKYGPGQLIVLQLDTPGGLVIEMEDIARVLTEVKKRHRIVAWVHMAISAGAATASFCDEIYFTTQGTLGSMTMVGGTITEEEMREWAQRAGEWFRVGGRTPYLGYTMVMQENELSYDKDPVTGHVTWYNTLQGEFVLSRKGQNLTFNSSNALHCGFADGIADTHEELAALLNLPEWHEVSDAGRRIHADWIRTMGRADEEIPRLIMRLNYYKQGGGNFLEVLGARIKIMEQLAQWSRRAPRQMMVFFGLPEPQVLERQIAELRKQVADIRREQRGGGGGRPR